MVSRINFKLHRYENHWVKVYILYSVNNSETCIFNVLFFGFLFKEKNLGVFGICFCNVKLPRCILLLLMTLE